MTVAGSWRHQPATVYHWTDAAQGALIGMLFAIARRVLKTRLVTVQHPCGVGELTVERIAGFDLGPVATGAEYRRHLRAANS